MDNLPDWAALMIAIAVGLSPSLAILSARLIARLLHQALWPRPEVEPGVKPTNEQAVAVATPARMMMR
jgi:hypothetical protein